MMNVHIQDILNDFEFDVKQGCFDKMPYNIWRELNGKRSKIGRVQYGFSSGKVYLIIDGEEYKFDTNDNSFGEFLYEMLMFEAEQLDDFIASGNYHSNAVYPYKYDTAVSQDFSVSNRIDSCYEKTPAVEINEDGMRIKGKTVEEIIDETLGNSINRKENKDMNLFKGFDFGSCENDKVKMSMYGIAVQNANGTWVSYDPKSGNVIDVDILNFDAKYLYKMPVAIKDVKPGDVVIHNRKPMFVVNIDGSKLDVIDPAAGEEKIVLLTKSMFGFDFVTKVVNFLGNISAGASEDAPFGNILPLMLLADGGKSDDMLPLMFLTNGGNFDMSNPMMLYFLMKNGGKSNDMLPLYFFMNGSYLGAPNAKNCNCGCNNADA